MGGPSGSAFGDLAIVFGAEDASGVAPLAVVFAIGICGNASVCALLSDVEFDGMLVSLVPTLSFCPRM